MTDPQDLAERRRLAEQAVAAIDLEELLALIVANGWAVHIEPGVYHSVRVTHYGAHVAQWSGNTLADSIQRVLVECRVKDVVRRSAT